MRLLAAVLSMSSSDVVEHVHAFKARVLIDINAYQRLETHIGSSQLPTRCCDAEQAAPNDT
jgi:hypothetical protein